MIDAAALHRIAEAYRLAVADLGRSDRGPQVSEPVRRAVLDVITGLAGAPESRCGEPLYARIVQAVLADLPKPLAELVLRAMRPALTRAFSFAVPTGAALDRVAALGTVVEVGAGSGYWAAALAARGAHVQAFDRVAPAATIEGPGRQLRHFDVRIGGPTEAVAATPETRALLLCWPPGRTFDRATGADLGFSGMGQAALDGFRGDTVVFVGDESPSFGSPAFFARLDREFTVEARLPIPNLGDWHDAVKVFRRR